MFRLTIAQLIKSGSCRQLEIIKVFGVSKSSVIRAQNKLKEGGSTAFFKNNRGRKKRGTILTPEVLEQAQSLLDDGLSRKETAKRIDVKYDTLRKAVSDGRLQEQNDSRGVTNKSIRTVIDAAQADRMGTACTRIEERTYAAFGVCEGAPVRFEPCVDVPKGGVLSALPALLANGLMEGADSLLGTVKGYYTTFHILLLLAFMALCRIKTVEKIRRESAGTLYIDGHVRLYHGSLTKPPRRYVSRERLCLRGTTDYWCGCPP